MREYAISLVELDLRPTMVGRLKSVPDDLGARFLELLPKIAEIVISRDYGLSGAPFARYLGQEGDLLDVEVGLMLISGGSTEGDIMAGTIPGGPHLKTLHTGPYRLLGNAHEALLAWAETNGRTINGAPFEVYVSDPDDSDDPATWRTEVYMPVSEPLSTSQLPSA